MPGSKPESHGRELAAAAPESPDFRTVPDEEDEGSDGSGSGGDGS